MALTGKQIFSRFLLPRKGRTIKSAIEELLPGAEVEADKAITW